MADDQKPAEPKKENTEPSAADLLSLWGGAPTSAPSPSTPPPSAPLPTMPKPPSIPPDVPKPAAPPAQSAVPPRQPAPVPPKHEHKPSPRPESMRPEPAAPRPEPAAREKQKAPPPPPREKEKALEGEIVTGKSKADTAAPKASPAAPAAIPPEPEFLEEREGFGAKLDEFLQELNLSRKHIVYGIGCLILLIALVFGGIAGFRYYKDRKTQPTETPMAPPPAAEAEMPQPEIEKEIPGVPQTAEVGKITPLTEESIGETGLIAAIHIGTQEALLTRIANYIMTFRRLQNAYGSDINELLDKATDRRSRFRSHLALLRKLHEEGTESLNTIKAELEVIKVSHEPERAKQGQADINFFEQLNALNPQTTEEILYDFIDASQKIAAFRARFKALQKIETFYEEALPKLSNRIRDMELNEEALVSGIKVYDVKGSDLQLILPVSGEPVEEEKLSSSAIPLIPTHPSQVKTDKDFITKPGGGF